MKRAIHGLYVIIDPSACLGRAPVEIALGALEGGAAALQWRDKLRDKGDQFEEASAIGAMCRERGVIFIVNDHADLAIAAGADGVHLGQRDLPIEAVRPVVGDGMIIGVSTNNVDEARRAEALGADYVALGAIFPTTTKEVTRPANLARLREVRIAVAAPLVAIGGIDAANVASVIEAGADAAAVISAVCGAPDPVLATAELAAAFVPRANPQPPTPNDQRLTPNPQPTPYTPVRPAP